MKNTVFPHKFWRPFLDCMPQLFFRSQYVWFPVHLKGHLIPLCYETLVVNWQNWLFTLFHQSRSVLSPNPINNTPSLVQIMAWRRPGDKPLSEPMMVSLTTHICVTRPQWVTGHWGFVLLSLIVTNIKDYLNCNAYLFVQHWGDLKKHIIFLSFQWCHTKIHFILRPSTLNQLT